MIYACVKRDFIQRENHVRNTFMNFDDGSRRGQLSVFYGRPLDDTSNMVMYQENDELFVLNFCLFYIYVRAFS